MSMLTGRYSGSLESTVDYDIRQIDSQGLPSYAKTIEDGELSEAYWATTLPQLMDTSMASSPYFRVFQAAQVKRNETGFLSRDITVRSLIEVKSDIHHMFPRDYLKKQGLTRNQYNQIANYAVTPSEINMAIGNKEPKQYFSQLQAQGCGGPKLYGNIVTPEDLQANYLMHCVPEGIESMTAANYPAFLAVRRKLMAQKMRLYFESL
jgi:hypothetical protein